MKSWSQSACSNPRASCPYHGGGHWASSDRGCSGQSADRGGWWWPLLKYSWKGFLFPCAILHLVKLRQRETRCPCMKLSPSLEKPKVQRADVRRRLRGALSPGGSRVHTSSGRQSTALIPSHTALGHSAHLLCRQSGVTMEIGPLSPALPHPCLFRPSHAGLGGRRVGMSTPPAATSK